MSLPAAVAPAIMETIMCRLAPLFEIGANGQKEVAYDAARQMLSAYHAATEDELSLAADIICCRFQVLEALSSAAASDLPLNKVLRLRGGAVSLSRECHKSQRKLDQLQRDRRAAAVLAPAEPAAITSEPDTAEMTATVRKAMQAVTRSGAESWSKALQKRQTAKRIADNLKKHQGGDLAQSGHAAARLATERAGRQPSVAV